MAGKCGSVVAGVGAAGARLFPFLRVPLITNRVSVFAERVFSRTREQVEWFEGAVECCERRSSNERVGALQRTFVRIDKKNSKLERGVYATRKVSTVDENIILSAACS